MTCKHKLKMLRTSGVLYQGSFTEIEVWQCSVCEKYMIIELKTGKKISLDNRLGDEI
jgi:hypothetical protein